MNTTTATRPVLTPRELALLSVDREAAKEALELAACVMDAETFEALIADARQAEEDFLADIRAADAAYARRARHDLLPGQRLGNR